MKRKNRSEPTDTRSQSSHRICFYSYGIRSLLWFVLKIDPGSHGSGPWTETTIIIITCFIDSAADILLSVNPPPRGQGEGEGDSMCCSRAPQQEGTSLHHPVLPADSTMTKNTNRQKSTMSVWELSEVLSHTTDLRSVLLNSSWFKSISELQAALLELKPHQSSPLDFTVKNCQTTTVKDCKL